MPNDTTRLLFIQILITVRWQILFLKHQYDSHSKSFRIANFCILWNRMGHKGVCECANVRMYAYGTNHTYTTPHHNMLIFVYVNVYHLTILMMLMNENSLSRVFHSIFHRAPAFHRDIICTIFLPKRGIEILSVYILEHLFTAVFEYNIIYIYFVVDYPHDRCIGSMEVT